MNSSAQFLNASEAARRLGVSAKALRLYEQRGLIDPLRTSAGWRAYGPDQMARAAEIVSLRALGLSLAQVARVLEGDSASLEAALATHQADLEGQAERLAATIDRVRALRSGLARGQAPVAGELRRMVGPADPTGIAFDLPWPWGGERFELNEIRPITYITGPLGSGKTRLARAIAASLPKAAYLDIDRGPDAQSGPNAPIEAAMTWLVEDGAVVSDALRVLLHAVEEIEPAALVVDLIEQGLDQASQEALMRYLRRRKPDDKPVFILTRSSSILDLACVGPNETVLFCPANHSPPKVVAPYPGSPGFEALASCLAPPDVRARTEGVVAMRPNSA